MANDIVKWVERGFGPGKKYRSARALSIAAGRHPNAVAVLLETGPASAELVVALSRAMDVSVHEPLLIIGFFQPEDLMGELNSDEVQLLTTLRRLSITDRRTVLRVTASLLGDNADVNESNILSQMDSSEPVSSEEKTPHPSGK